MSSTYSFYSLEENKFEDTCIPHYRNYYTLLQCLFIFPILTPQTVNSLKAQLSLICLYTMALGQFFLPSPCPASTLPSAWVSKHLNSNAGWEIVLCGNREYPFPPTNSLCPARVSWASSPQLRFVLNFLFPCPS